MCGRCRSHLSHPFQGRARPFVGPPIRFAWGGNVGTAWSISMVAIAPPSLDSDPIVAQRRLDDIRTNADPPYPELPIPLDAANDHDRARRVVSALLADRAQEQRRETADPARADDQQVPITGFAEGGFSSGSFDDCSFDGDLLRLRGDGGEHPVEHLLAQL